MKKRFFICTLMSCLLFMLSGCGKDDDKLVLVTTEKAMVTETEELETTEATASDALRNTEAASDEEQKITLDQIYTANSGDKLLAGGKGCGLNITYYANDKEYYSEYRYLGFDKDGTYVQAYENSDGEKRILDLMNECWYVVNGESITTLLYPENGAFALVVGYGHDDLIFASTRTSTSKETLASIYRENGKLIAETNVIGESGEDYVYRYALGDDLKISSYVCYDLDGNKIADATVAEEVYEFPAIIKEIKDKGLTREIKVVYKDGSVPEYTYYVAPEYPIDITVLEHTAYSDESCTLPWEEAHPQDGVYKDIAIYLKQ